jgi:hypothetical protein
MHIKKVKQLKTKVDKWHAIVVKEGVNDFRYLIFRNKYFKFYPLISKDKKYPPFMIEVS